MNITHAFMAAYPILDDLFQDYICFREVAALVQSYRSQAASRLDSTIIKQHTTIYPISVS